MGLATPVGTHVSQLLATPLDLGFDLPPAAMVCNTTNKGWDFIKFLLDELGAYPVLTIVMPVSFAYHTAYTHTQANSICPAHR